MADQLIGGVSLLSIFWLKISMVGSLAFYKSCPRDECVIMVRVSASVS